MDQDPYIRDGWVTNNKDPEGRHRVKVRVPGMYEPESDWALPMATIGGGSENRGGFLTPGEGAVVGVYANGGDRDQPRYFCGYWPAGKLPEENGNGDPDTLSISLGGVRFTLAMGRVDASNPKGRGYVRVCVTPGAKGTFMELDGEANRATLRGITNTFVTSVGRVLLDALTVQFYGNEYGKVVLKTPRPIQ